MRPLTFSEACSELADLAPDSRVRAMRVLAAAMQQGAADRVAPGALKVFDPLECLAADASRCEYFGRPVPHEQRVCLVALDPDVPCPQAGR
jgi:hypothetical protein